MTKPDARTMTDAPQTTEADFPRIWLQPAPPDGMNDERLWCQNDVWTGEPDYDGAVPTEYVRADLAAVKDAEIKRLRAALRECVDDLQPYIIQEYGPSPHIYPAMARRYERDMEIVRTAQKMLEGTDA